MYKIEKILFSSFAALIILSIFSFFYNNLPTSIPCEDGVTSSRKRENIFYSSAIAEGIVWGKMNNEGYNNLFDYDKTMPIDILVMGSSHMEAMQVMQDESTASKLNKLYGRGG